MLASTAPQSLNRKQRRLAAKQAKKTGRAPAATNPEVQLILNAALAQQRAGRLQEAEAQCRRALELAPDDYNVLFLLGAVLSDAGRGPEAVDFLQRAAALAPGNPHVYRGLAVVLDALGRPEEAVEHYRRAVALKPDYGDAYTPLALSLHRCGRLPEAWQALQTALRLNPDDPQILGLLSLVHRDMAGPAVALDALRDAVAAKPGDSAARLALGVSLLCSGQAEAAREHLIKAVIARPNSASALHGLDQALKAVPPTDYDPELAEALTIGFDSPVLDHQYLAAFAAHQIKLRYLGRPRLEQGAGEPGSGTKLHLDGILGDALLLQLLQKAVNCAVELEALLIGIRRSLLFTARAQAALQEAALLFIASLATQCHHNSYVMAAEPDEIAEVERLQDEIARDLAGLARPDPALELKLALYGQYKPLHCLPNFEILEGMPAASWSARIQPLIRIALLNPQEEQRLKASIPAIGTIDDAVSQAVRSQYEANPYPRWISMPPPRRESFPQFIATQFPTLCRDLPPFLHQPIEILIAGCGTGQHPIGEARHFANARIVAIDLSLASLAYAKRMAAQLDVSNIEFYQGDILNFDALGRDFPVIESCGVLHHMADPEAGLRALLRRLRPGGFIKLALYSESARQWMVAARARIAELGLEPTPENISRFRLMVMGGQELAGSSLMQSKDFYDLDSVRDLLFHCQEHRFTVPQLKSLLGRHGLEFLGFTFPEETEKRAYGEIFPQDKEMRDLDAWHAFEEANPQTFRRMYQFWCRKAP